MNRLRVRRISTRRARDARASTDSGVTLIELLFCVALLGVVMPVVLTLFVTIVRNTPTTTDRIDAAHSLQGIVTWLPQDVDSTPPGGYDTLKDTVSGCTLSPGVNLLRLEWAEKVGSATVRYVANYRYVAISSGFAIQRITCQGSGAGPLGNVVIRGTSSNIRPMPVNWQPGELPVDVTITTDASGDVNVNLRVETLSGKVVSTDAAPKNPANTLVPVTSEAVPDPPTTVAATTTTVAPTTTTVVDPTSTTAAPSATTTPPTTTTTPASTTTTLPPCVVLTAVLSPASVKNTDPNGNGNSAAATGVLQSAVTLTVTTAGVCIGLEARPQRGAPNGELFHNFTQTGSTWVVSLPGYPQGSSELWADGDRPVQIYSAAGGPHATVTLQVK